MKTMDKTSILVVEDEFLTRADIQYSLEKFGYLVRGSSDTGEDAIRKAGELRPDLTLMDITLKGKMSGIEAAEKIKESFGIPVVFLTAHSDDATVEKALSSEPFGYLVKPLDERALKTTIQMALYKHGVERQLKRLTEELEIRVNERTAELTATVRKLEQEISERKRVEANLKVTHHKLALMNDVAYQDIRNKVTGLRGYCELIKNASDETERAGFLEKSGEILKTIHHRLENTQEYQHIGEDPIGWINVEKLIRESFSRVSRDKEVTLYTDLHGLEIYSDPFIERVFYNLIQNAIRHGQKITRITFGCRKGPDGVILQCEDDGIGIPFENKGSVFDRIVSGEGKFGLFFVKEFLMLSGMTVSETGVPGTGARFEIAIPREMYRLS